MAEGGRGIGNEEVTEPHFALPLDDSIHINPYRYKVVPCQRHLQGLCEKGDYCQLSHGRPAQEFAFLEEFRILYNNFQQLRIGPSTRASSMFSGYLQPRPRLTVGFHPPRMSGLPTRSRWSGPRLGLSNSWQQGPSSSRPPWRSPPLPQTGPSTMGLWNIRTRLQPPFLTLPQSNRGNHNQNSRVSPQPSSSANAGPSTPAPGRTSDSLPKQTCSSPTSTRPSHHRRRKDHSSSVGAGSGSSSETHTQNNAQRLAPAEACDDGKVPAKNIQTPNHANLNVDDETVWPSPCTEALSNVNEVRPPVKSNDAADTRNSSVDSSMVSYSAIVRRK